MHEDSDLRNALMVLSLAGIMVTMEEMVSPKRIGPGHLVIVSTSLHILAAMPQCNCVAERISRGTALIAEGEAMMCAAGLPPRVKSMVEYIIGPEPEYIEQEVSH